jgi:hypothetical protein
VRLGDPFVSRIREAMIPHLFVDSDPPAVHVAALGDLGGAIGASLLVKPARRRRPATAGRPRATRSKARSDK